MANPAENTMLYIPTLGKVHLVTGKSPCFSLIRGDKLLIFSHPFVSKGLIFGIFSLIFSYFSFWI
ncbi:hypothetical protein DRJ00_05060 [Candidatus Aerophobetes bacterium]|uniref:Uncharacterized protein n=1 Tax=Aerophobetes bacterium TaxID=2030807 RepID=A0A497E3L5_UNCAE|nr:MAG: hypothetical protein DRJ00_05060 [Candidatus Aerophobetes bacterium]